MRNSRFVAGQHARRGGCPGSGLRGPAPRELRIRSRRHGRLAPPNRLPLNALGWHAELRIVPDPGCSLSGLAGLGWLGTRTEHVSHALGPGPPQPLVGIFAIDRSALGFLVVPSAVIGIGGRWRRGRSRLPRDGGPRGDRRRVLALPPSLLLQEFPLAFGEQPQRAKPQGHEQRRDRHDHVPATGVPGASSRLVDHLATSTRSRPA